MSDLRRRPKNNYLQSARWEELYTLTMYWKSDIDFYKNELKFLHNLIGKYLIWIFEEKDLPIVQKRIANLNQLSGQIEVLETKLNKHLESLQELLNNKFMQGRHKFRNSHANLEDDIIALSEAFRKEKMAISGVLEYTITSEKFLQKLIT